ncbi:hypothetical protein BGX21_002221 [Mortierella sp. AD011]|nr:hypothetical protein BGX20_002430 [Mortierella sp. AD010]KAF9401254.1 hypothetical protein BGX21_002221 [Mortierella sp. AD011]
MGDTSSVIDKFIHHPFAVLYQVDLPFPGYDRDAPSFHWKYDAVVETLISNNPPSSRRSKVQSGSSTVNTSSSPAQPMIGHRMLSRAQRKDIKKVHVPKGVVMQYEGELVNFLDQLTLTDAKDEKNEEENNRGEENDSSLSQSVESSVEDSNWVIIQSTDALDTQPVESSQLSEATEAKELKQSSDDTNKEDMIVKPQIFLRWDIQDQFLRFIAHALCSFYGLVSFSKTALDGKRLIYICHPTHLDSIGQLTVAPPTLPASKPEPTAAVPTRPKSPKRQSTLEHVQELPLQELDLLWDRVEPVKVAGCSRPEMTFFEYLYPSTRSMF